MASRAILRMKTFIDQYVNTSSSSTSILRRVVIAIQNSTSPNSSTTTYSSSNHVNGISQSLHRESKSEFNAPLESAAAAEKQSESEDSLWNLYERWMSHFDLSYDLNEKQARFKIFKENMKFINQWNDKNEILGLNRSVDITPNGDDGQGYMLGIPYNEKDMESTESLWNLYERWIRRYYASRDPKEKLTRFKIFVENLMEKRRNNIDDRWRLDKSADMTNKEYFSFLRNSSMLHRRFFKDKDIGKYIPSIPYFMKAQDTTQFIPFIPPIEGTEAELGKEGRRAMLPVRGRGKCGIALRRRRRQRATATGTL